MKEKLGEQMFEIEQTKDYYSKKVEELEERIGELLEEKLINTSKVSELSNKYYLET